MVRDRKLGFRLPLLAGFGSLLALMAFANVDAIQALRRIHVESEQIRQNYLTRNRSLGQIRSGLYLSGTYMRDFLLERQESHKKGLEETQARLQKALDAYSGSLRPDETGAARTFRDLEAEVSDYWNVMDPVLHWGPEERKARGDKFLRRELMPHRTAVLKLAARISNLNERDLRDGDRRLNAVYTSYRQRLIWIAAATLALGVIVAVMAVYGLLRLERAEQRRYKEVKQLSARLLKAQEEERRAISRELHDEVGQSLTALLMEAGNLGATTPVECVEFRGHVESIKKLADSSVKAVRNMALLLRPSMLDDLGLIPALEWQAREMTKRTGIEVEVKADEMADGLPDDHKTCIYRVVQEALHNCSRHAGARSVWIAMARKPQGISLVIRDDGKGFDSSRVRGLGLLGMEERVKSIGGSFQVTSGPGRGTLLSINLPL
jgi:signal transduction histidine kinase